MFEIASIISPEIEASINASAEELTKNKFINTKLTVKTAEDLQVAIEFMTGLKAYYRAKEEERKTIVDPIKKSVKLIDAKFKVITDKIAEAISGVEAEIFKYRQAEAVKIAKENARIAAKVAAEQAKVEAKFDKEIKGTRGDVREILTAQKESAVASVAVAAPVKTQEKTITGTSFRKIANQEAIQAAIDKSDGRIVIAGVRVYKVWKFEIMDAKAIPEEYKKEISATRF